MLKIEERGFVKIWNRESDHQLFLCQFQYEMEQINLLTKVQHLLQVKT